MPYVENRGVSLKYEDSGLATGTTLLFVHGWTCDRTFFAPQMAFFAARYRVVSLDLRGHGQSDKPLGNYPIEQYSEDIWALIRYLKLTKVIAIGHSMGGSIVLDMASANSGEMIAIVMLDPASFVRTAEVLRSVENLLTHLRANDKAYQKDFILTKRFLPTSNKAITDKVLATMLATDNDVAVSAMIGLLAFDAIGAAAKCVIPALHVAATPPLNLPERMSYYLPTVVNGWTVGAGHFHQLEAPDQVNLMIEAFIAHYLGAASAIAD